MNVVDRDHGRQEAPQHERYRQEIGAYLLGALTQSEVDAFEEHLGRCAGCQEELHRLRVAADALPGSVDPVEPPTALRRSLMATVRAEAASRREAAAARSQTPSWRARRGWAMPRPALAWAAAAVLLAGGVLTGIALERGAGSGAGGARVLAANVDRSVAPAGRASLRIGGGAAGAVLSVSGLPSAGDGHVYEVWLQRGGSPQPISLFGVTPNGSGSAGIPLGLGHGDRIMVTREQATGASAPTSAPIVRIAV